MPSVIALLERREARAREELDVWLERLREAEDQVTSCQERLDRARIGREEVLRALAEEAVGDAAGPEVSAGTRVVTDVDASAACLPAGYDPRPPVWRAGLAVEALAGAYRQVFEAVAAGAGPVSARELTACLGRDATRLNEIEKVRHRAYALQARGWLDRVPGGLFTLAAGPAGGAGTPASAGAGAPTSG